ncbi:MAG: hypothetical protein M1830_010481 [Pleopsidium flavum]|nr:MAG: hypothetical protein M1830_010481 [Pleopsidium flavum]
MENQQFPATPTRKSPKPIFSQLIMSSSDLLGSQLGNKPIKILTKPKKRRAMASPSPSPMQSPVLLLKNRVNVNQTPEPAAFTLTSEAIVKTKDQMLLEARELIKQAHQQSSLVVQKDLEHSINALDNAREKACLSSLKQGDEKFAKSIEENVQQQINNLKTEMNQKFN